MTRDQNRLRRRVAAVRSARDEAARQALVEQLDADVAAAERRLARRQAAVPEITYPAELPISQRRDEILAAIRDHPVVIVAGETGSGKTTQIPKICLELGRGVRGTIGHTQPRRIAARTVAERIAEELGVPMGGAVGYQVRFTDRASDSTLVKLMTDGILLAEIQRDRMLRQYDTLIIDEAHERSLNIDFILGYVKQLLPARPDLKVIITSATIDPDRFSRHFDGAPVVEVSGRTYPVEIRYRPVLDVDELDDEDELDDPDDPDDAQRAGAGRGRGSRPGAGRAAETRGSRTATPANSGRRDGSDRDQADAICDAVDELIGEGPGDILVFLSGEREIRDTADALGKLSLPQTEVLPLYARLSAADQHRVFQAHQGRRIVLATNVAETSLTVPGIRYVIDPGTARISRYSARTKVQRLPIERISQASANQRAGRCGRLSDGICIRLYTVDDYESRPEFTDPEILRTNLASVILQMTALGLGDVAAFPFLDPPDKRNIAAGVQLLEELGALNPAEADPAKRLTGLGRKLAQLPVDPRLARMVLAAADLDCVPEVLVIAAALSIQDPRERPPEKQQAADEKHRRFADPSSDFITYLNLWNYLSEQQRALSSSQFRRLCKAEFLHYLRVREWQDLAGQLRQVARTLGIHAALPDSTVDSQAADGADGDGPAGSSSATDARLVHQALLSGLLSQIGLRDGDKQDYAGARNARFVLWPGSALARRPPRWVMAAELVETSRLWARVVARIEPDWVERIAGPLLVRTYSEPRWDAARGAVMASERVTLYGLPLVASRPVNYGRIDPAVSRELFIRHALVEGDWHTNHRFYARNQQRLADVAALEDRARRRDILVDDETLFDFYDRRIGPDVVSARHFDSWWKKTRRDQPDLLDFPPELLISPQASEVSPAAYPDSWQQPGLTLPLSYAFEPGTETDGVTLDIPLAALSGVRAEDYAWQVPGLRLELVTALIRTLPKQLRRNFVPAPDVARAVLGRVSPADGPLIEALSRELLRMSGVRVPLDAWAVDRLPEYLRITFRVVDDAGHTLATGKDLPALQEKLKPKVRQAIAAASPGIERSGIKAWDFGELPRTFSREWSGNVLRGYPALVDAGDSVAIRVFESEAEQARAMRAGTRRLVLLNVPSPVRYVASQLSNRAKLTLTVNPHGSVAALLADCVSAAVDKLVDAAGGPAWDGVGFDALLAAVRAGLNQATLEIVGTVEQILAAAQEVDRTLKTLTAPGLRTSVVDAEGQLRGLVHNGFITEAGAAALPDLVRYLRALSHRLERLPADPARDLQHLVRFRAAEQAYHDLLDELPPGQADTPAVRHIRWMLEELRVSYFAQSLRTAYPISEQRIHRAIAAIP
jgi:ATP-dependent helicase HrpA